MRWQFKRGMEEGFMVIEYSWFGNTESYYQNMLSKKVSSSPSSPPLHSTKQTDEMLFSPGFRLHPRPEAADQEPPRPGNLYLPGLGAEKVSLSWTRELNAGLLWIAPTIDGIKVPAMDDDKLKDALDGDVLKDALDGAVIKIPAVDVDELKDALDGDALKDALDGTVIKVPAMDNDKLKDALDADVLKDALDGDELKDALNADVLKDALDAP